ncbi:MAG: ABC transporter ATP-binding protein [Planctomycetota bacterium]|nr:ABC transporter ATP-binding protein [Planctomycetota bacterium]
MIAETHLEEDYTKELDWGIWKKLARYARPYRREVIQLSVAGGLCAVLDTLYPLLMMGIIDDVIENRTAVDVWLYVGAYAGLTLMMCLCVWVFIWLAGRLRTHVSHDIRRDGFGKLQQLSFSYYDRRPVGWLMARMTSDCERLSNMFSWAVLDVAWGVTILVCVSVVMFLLNVKLALVVLSVVPALAWVSVYFRTRILRSARAVRKTNSRITASYNESIMGVRTSKVFVRERENLDDFRGLTSEMYGASIRNQFQSALYLPVIMSLGGVAGALALAAGGVEVMAGGVTVGTLFLFLWYARHFFEPIHHMAIWFAEMQMAQASAERILGLIDTVPEIRDAPGVRSTDGNGRIHEIEFRDVSFAYADGKPVLQNFDLKVPAGETIALVGATGGGKTTIVSLLCRFYEPTSGTILLDGVDYREYGLHWLQSKLGIVLQTPHLFSGTIKENIRYGHLGANDEEIRRVAELAGAHEFITRLDKGYSSEVGEGGILLSTGQKQLLSFARAILARPQILVMDEATSSVDTETERRIQAGLAHVLEGRTSFVIAHRLSTIRAADRILAIEKGRIVEEGTHADLLARKGRYYQLYTQRSLRDSVRSAKAWSG